jgi:hypothetical protein
MSTTSHELSAGFESAPVELAFSFYHPKFLEGLLSTRGRIYKLANKFTEGDTLSADFRHEITVTNTPATRTRTLEFREMPSTTAAVYTKITLKGSDIDGQRHWPKVGEQAGSALFPRPESLKRIRFKEILRDLFGLNQERVDYMSAHEVARTLRQYRKIQKHNARRDKPNSL